MEVLKRNFGYYLGFLAPSLFVAAIIWLRVAPDRLYYCWDDAPPLLISWAPSFVHPWANTGNLRDYFIWPWWAVYLVWFTLAAAAFLVPALIVWLCERKAMTPDPAGFPIEPAQPCGALQAMMFFLPLSLILLVAILFKNAVPFVFRLAGWRDSLQLEERWGSILFLFCSAILAGIDYWYPWYLCTYHASPDDRYGFAILFAFPFYFVGAGIAGLALFRLLRVVIREQRGAANWTFAVCGVLLALAGFSPLLMVGWRIVSLGNE